MSSFDRKICISNIYALAKEKGIRLGDLEKAGGVSVGYLSRLNKEDSTANPSIEFLVSVADQLEVPLEILISQPYGEYTPTESLLFSFLSKLSVQTVRDELVWQREPLSSYDDVFFDQGQCSHPLFDFDLALSEPEIEFISLFQPGRHPIDDGYMLQATGTNAFYLMKVNDIMYGYAYELYLVSSGFPRMVCHSGGSIRTFSKVLEQLYLIIAESCKHTKIPPDVKDAIEEFLGEKKKPGIELSLEDFLT